MSQIIPSGFPKVFHNVLELKQELKEKKHDLKLKLDPSLYIDFLKRLGQCEVQFHQLKDTCISSHPTSQLVQKLLSSMHQKLVQYAPDGIVIANGIRDNDPQYFLHEIAEKFKHHQSREAMDRFTEFENLYPQIATQVFENLRHLKGFPRNDDPNFQRDLFYGTEGLPTVLDMEKEEAVQCCFCSPVERLNQIQRLFEQNNAREALHRFAEFSQVYPKIADYTYGKVWEVYDRPTDQRHAHIAHYDFGHVAFHNQHPNPVFKIQWDKNGEAIGLVLQDLNKLWDSETFFAEQNIQRLDQRCVKVANETIDLFKKGEYASSTGKRHNLTEYLKFSSEQSRLYNDAGTNAPKQPRFPHTEFEVRSQNCVEMAYELSLNGNNTLVLNLGNSHKSGGAYLEHRGTQEEELFRCTGLAPVLDQRHGIQKQDFYPIHHKAGPSGGIYTPQVPIIRMGMKHDYSFYEQPMIIAAATFASYNQPKLDYSDPANPRLQGEELKWTKEKIRTIYRMAYENGHDTLVLGAIGCGAFSNPPRHIAELFMDVYEKEFKGCFKYVGFAVIEDMNYGKKHNPEGNFKPFARLVQQNGGKAYNSKGELLSMV